MDKLSKLPGPVKWVGGALAAIGLIGAGTALGRGKWIFLLALLVLLVLLLGGYLIWLALKLRKKSVEFENKVEELNRKSHLDVATASERAEIDNARRKFERGVKEYRKSGQNLYVLPWYLLVGLPGSGKTWCIRQSEVGFLPGMQDEMQGIGGTQYLDWWFTKHAVILDTAGKYMTEGGNWQDFLDLLKKYRPSCPINGLILAIPASDLFQDSKLETAQKAKQIAYQIAMIQKILDVSFPLFVVVTKCDLLPGFREFFDTLEDPRLRHQIFGWSNRASLDAPFDPNWVNQHIAGVVEQLNRRRLGLLAESAPSKDPQPRLDSMSELYELPHNFTQLAAPLRVYIEEVFSGNVFACKPPFFRGIYFTTSMQEGAPLDTAMWTRQSVKSPSVPAAGEAAPVARRDKSYFLRDLFLKKIFVEKGLVTTATNAMRRQRNWRIITFATGAVGLLLFLLVGFLGKNALRESVTDRSDHWTAVVSGWKMDESRTKVWHPIVDRSSDSDPWTYHGHDLVGEPKSTLVAFQTHLMELAENPPKISWVFRPLRWTAGSNLNERKAQRIVFEGSVLKPLVMAAREKLIAGPNGADTSPAGRQIYHDESLQAMKSIFLIDNKILSRGIFTGSGAPTPQDADANYLTPLLKFAVSDESFSADDSAELANVLSWTYSKGDGSGKWPPKYLCDGDTFETNLDIKYGFGRLMVFPLVAPPSDSDFLSGPVVQDFAAFAKVVDELNQNWSSRSELSRELQMRLNWLKPVLNTLVNPNTLNLATCKIILPGQQTSPLFRHWRYITLASTDLSGNTVRLGTTTGTAEDAVVGEVTLSQPLQISLRQHPEPSNKDIIIANFSDWGPIRLWFKYQEANPDGNSCTVKVPVKGGTIELKLEFDQPFPEKWPTQGEVLSGTGPES
jgi:hypothetical protein